MKSTSGRQFDGWPRQGLAALLLLIGCAVSRADELYLIANPIVDLSAGDVRDVFLGDKSMEHGVKLVPIDNVASQAQFLARVMQLETAKYQSIWIKKGFREGLAAPLTKQSDVEVIAFVRRTPGAIGYVSGLTELPSALGIRVIERR